ncbi:protein kinase domain-containing protein [Haliangium sp.]|uniref:serine/threonine-protein kinase n=1 Tax=Haliangium sp. TaxID=2663208 RepID=UPI003D0D28B4
MSLASSNAGALIGQRMGKYELVALLALGGTAEIYLARIGGVAGFEKYVVVKCLHDHLADDSEFVRMFLDEARLAAQLDHSNIVQTIELGEEQGRYYIVMEYLAGMSLSLVARRAAERVPGARLPVEQTLCMAAQACAGLHYAHQRHDPSGIRLNIVHRDVSPQNLVVSFEGIVKLVDFGIAKAELRDTQTRSGTIKGKFAYMSPEQCTAGHIDHRTDVFAMGVVVHELMTGRRLFKRASTYDTYRAIVEEQVPTPSQVNHELDPGLDEVVMKALAHDREQRYPSAEAFGEALTAALHRRGKAVSAGLVAGFFEHYFAKEITEHGERMRALIAGRKTVIDEQWDEPESDSAGDASDHPDGDVSTVDLAMGHHGATTSLGLDDNNDSYDPGDDNDEATRIELNPLIEEELAAARAAAAANEHAPSGSDTGGSEDVGVADTVALTTNERGDVMAMPSPIEVAGGHGPRPSTSAERPPAGRAASPSAEHLALAKTLAPSSAAPIPHPPELPGAGASARGQALRAPVDDFGTARTSPAGPMGLRSSREDLARHHPADDGGPDQQETLLGGGAVAPQRLPLAAPAPTAPSFDAVARPPSAPPRPRTTANVPHAAGEPALAKEDQGLPIWLLGVLFVLSVGIGLGATLLIHRLL